MKEIKMVDERSFAYSLYNSLPALGIYINYSSPDEDCKYISGREMKSIIFRIIRKAL
jgi:hypothetical protein